MMSRCSLLLACSLSLSLGCGSSDDPAAGTEGGGSAGEAGAPGSAGRAGSAGGSAAASGKAGAAAGGAAGAKGGGAGQGGTIATGGAAGAAAKGGGAGNAGKGNAGGNAAGGAGSGAGGPAAGGSTTGGAGGEVAGAGAGGEAAGGGGGDPAGGAAGDPAGGAGGAGGDTGAGGAAGGGTGPTCQDSLTDYPDGSVTFYDLGGTAVNCSFEVVSQKPDVIAYVPFGGGQFFGAMNTTDYNSAGVCGACVEVTREDKGASVSLMIVDQCPSGSNPLCKSGHIDMSRAAFLQIGTESEGYLGTTNGGATGKISWKYVACPAMDSVSFRLKEPSNQYWNQILVEGHRYAIAKLEAQVKGVWQPATRQSYNYWQVGSGNLGTPPYQIRVTDVNGSVIEASLDLVAGDQTSPGQFPLCQ